MGDEQMNRSEKWRTLSSKLICATLALVGVYVLLKYALGILMPFIIAVAISAPANALAKKSSKKFSGGLKCWSVFYVAVFWILLFCVLFLFVKRVFIQAGGFFEYLSQDGGKISTEIEVFVRKIANIFDNVPFLKNSAGDGADKIGESVENTAAQLIGGLAQKGGDFVARAVGNFLVGTPRAVVSIVVCVMSSVYLSMDFDNVKKYLLNIFSKEKREGVKNIVHRISLGIKGYFKAYFLLYLINFFELFIGFTIMQRSYSMFLAMALGFLDILPFFSVAVVLIPWGVFLIANGETGLGIGMMVLALIMAIVRQISEPRLVGKNLGIHPLASLVSMYIGVRVFGFWGMILAPVSMLMIKEFLKSRGEN